MTLQQLAALAELRAKVTPGPWLEWSEEGPVDTRLYRHSVCKEEGGHVCIANALGSDEVTAYNNAALIAMANPGMFALADEVAALTAELARVTAERDDADIECGGYIGMLDRAKDDLAAANVTIAALTTELARRVWHSTCSCDGDADTDDLAKAAAQADYTARILAALEPVQPDAGVSVADAAKVLLADETALLLAGDAIAQLELCDDTGLDDVGLNVTGMDIMRVGLNTLAQSDAGKGGAV